MGRIIILPSNASMGLYPENTLSDYRTKLPFPLNLEGNYEAALMEIQYPRTYNNITVSQTHVTITILRETSKFRIKPGFYRTADQLVAALNSGIIHHIEKLARTYPKIKIYEAECQDRKQAMCEFVVNERMNKVFIHFKPRVRIHISNDMKDILGFNTNMLKPEKDAASHDQEIVTVEGQHQIDTYQSRYSIFVYCSIVTPQIVGDSFVPLLRAVPVEGEHGLIVTKTYIRPHYFPLKKNYIDEIEISLRDSVGEKIPFERGRVIVTLDIRKRADF